VANEFFIVDLEFAPQRLWDFDNDFAHDGI
jgi:hypothetical protein